MWHEMRNNQVGADADKPLALPLVNVDPAKFVHGRANSDSAGLFGALDFNEAIAAPKPLDPAHIVFFDYAFDDERFDIHDLVGGQVLLILGGALNIKEESGNSQRGYRIAHKRLVGARDDLHPDAALVTRL